MKGLDRFGDWLGGLPDWQALTLILGFVFITATAITLIILAVR